MYIKILEQIYNNTWSTSTVSTRCLEYTGNNNAE